MVSVQAILNQLWTGVMKKHAFDLFNHTIELEIETMNDGTRTSYLLKIFEVKSVYYINDQEPFEPDEDDYLEITSISYVVGKKVEMDIVGPANKSIARGSPINLIFEIWGREMYIEAGYIEINGSKHELN